MIGAFLGAVIVWLAYLPHWAATEDKGGKLAVFATGPAIRNPLANVITEIIGTAVLVLGVLAILRPENLVANSGFDKGFAPFLVGLLVWAIGLSLAARPATRSTPRATSARASRTPSSPSPAKATAIGATRGSPLSARSSAACSAP